MWRSVFWKITSCSTLYYKNKQYKTYDIAEKIHDKKLVHSKVGNVNNKSLVYTSYSSYTFFLYNFEQIRRIALIHNQTWLQC